jgi:hypothetical protein
MVDNGGIHDLDGTEWDGVKYHHSTQNGAQFKSYELLSSRIFHLIFSEYG